MSNTVTNNISSTDDLNIFKANVKTFADSVVAQVDLNSATNTTNIATLTSTLALGSAVAPGTVAAAGTTAADAGLLTVGFNLVTAADGTKGVKLPTAAAGKQVIIKNNTNAILKIWPFAGDAINAIAADSSMSIAALTSVILYSYDATTWYTVPLLPS